MQYKKGYILFGKLNRAQSEIEFTNLCNLSSDGGYFNKIVIDGM